MTRPRRAIDTPEPTPQRGRSALLVAFLAVLSVGGVWAASPLPASADTHEPTPTPLGPQAIVQAEAGPGCGGVTVGVTGTYLEWYRADLDTADSNPNWVRQSPGGRDSFPTHQMVDSPFVQYRVIWATGEDRTAVIEVEPCPTTGESVTPSPEPTETATPAPTPTATGTPEATTGPTAAATASPATPADKTETGGLASTGV